MSKDMPIIHNISNLINHISLAHEITKEYLEH